MRIRQWLEEVRKNTLHLFADVDEADFRYQVHADFSPVGWHLGHIGVTEAYWILQRCKGDSSLSVAYDRFFSPTDNPKPNRMRLPARSEILTYLSTEREKILAFLERVDFSQAHPLLQEGRIFHMLLQHEEQHQETILFILHMLAARHVGSWLSFPVSHPKHGECLIQPRHDMIYIPGGAFLMGSRRVVDTLDNEHPQHLVSGQDFLIDRYPVTNGEFLWFVQNGGYHRRSWWSPEGWQWREQNGIEHPLYWRTQPNGQWTTVGLGSIRPLALNHPVMCVSWYEADAYARSLGKRLPTEAEWEKAASWDPESQTKRRYPWGEAEPEASRCNFNVHVYGTAAVGHSPAGRSAYGCQDMNGNVWEWTATWFHPYPGFVAYPYDGYSAPYFDQQHRVLRGGSWATRRHVIRSTFRNWYHPWVREIFAGFRCAQDP